MLKLTVKLIAEKQGLNRNQLQLKSGVTLPLLTRYWNNNTTEVKLDALEKIAQALGVMPGELIVSNEDLEEADVSLGKVGRKPGKKADDNIAPRPAVREKQHEQ